MTVAHFPASGITPAQAGALLHPGYVSGRYYSPASGTSPLTTTALANDLLYLFPLPWFGGPVAGLSLRQGTPVAGALGRLGLYSRGATYEGEKTLIAPCVGEIDFNVALANATCDLSFASLLNLPFGMYWGGALFTGSPQPHAMTQASTVGHNITNFVGGNGMAAFTNNTAGAFIRNTAGAFAYASGLPAVTSTVTSNFATPGSPIMAWRA